MEFDGNLKYCEYPCAMYAGENCVLNECQKFPRRTPNIECDMVSVHNDGNPFI